MTTKTEFRIAIRRARGCLAYPGVHTVGRGIKIKNGVSTGEECVVFSVENKGSQSPEAMLPHQMGTFEDVVSTDVVEMPQFVADNGATRPHRPVPGGVSGGHPDITAGTCGGWLRRIGDERSYLLTNAHVAADVNRARIGDPFWQPGEADGGDSVHRIGSLAARVAIHFGDEPPPEPPENGDGDDGKKGKGLASSAWRSWLWPANTLARLTGCDRRAMVLNPRNQYRISNTAAESVVTQPWPNRVDAAIVLADSEDIAALLFHDRDWLYPEAIRDLVLGDAVRKTGRTTGATFGTVVQVEATSRVSYGRDGAATFGGQVVVQGLGRDFSAGGDSGSWILHNNEDGHLGAILFAGGGGFTIVNPISSVFSLLGLEL